MRKGYRDFDYRRVFSRLFTFCTIDLSALYFDIRKDTLYCDPIDSVPRAGPAGRCLIRFSTV